MGGIRGGSVVMVVVDVLALSNLRLSRVVALWKEIRVAWAYRSVWLSVSYLIADRKKGQGTNGNQLRWRYVPRRSMSGTSRVVHMALGVEVPWRQEFAKPLNVV